VVVCAIAWLSPPQTGGEVDRILDAWEAKVRELKSFKCRFRQEKKVSFLRRPLVSTGTIAYRERHLLWKTESPSEGFLSVDEKEVRIFTPEFNTLEVIELGAKPPDGNAPPAGGAKSQEAAPAPALAGAFPGFTGDLKQVRDIYDVELLPPPPNAPAAAKQKRLRLTPRSDALKKEVVAVEITFGETMDVEAWRIVRANGDELALTLQEFQANAKVADAELRFETPADVKVTRLSGAGAGK
jgi:outer membrane lipoprotein-sorting protein